MNREKSSSKISSKTTLKEVRKNSSKWTPAEDKLILEQFDLFRGTRSVYEVIASDPQLR